MSQKHVLVLGSAGAGKSTLINKILGKNEDDAGAATVGHRRMADGTSAIEKLQGEGGIAFIDTPGLDSNNFPVRMVDKIQSLHDDVNSVFMVVLVINFTVPRITRYLTDFDKAIENLIGSPRITKFCIIWTHFDGSDLLPEDHEAVTAAYPHAVMLFDNDIGKIKETFHDRSLFNPLKLHKATILAANPTPVTATKKKAAAAPAAKKKKAIPVGIPIVLNGLDGFGKHNDAVKAAKNPASKMVTCLKEVLKLKQGTTTPGDVTEYQDLKLVGDAFLESTVLGCLRAHGERGELGTKLDRLKGNSDTCAMPRFFNDHIAVEHNKVFPEEAGVISGHGKADVVEALLEYTRVHEPSVFRYILIKLFQIVEMGAVVGR